MTDWMDARWAAFDVESTGVDVHSDRIVTACVVTLGGNVPTDARSWLINPGIPIPPGATAIHGITDERAETEGMGPAVAVDQIAGELCSAWACGLPVVAFNASFDFSMLAAELDRYDLPSLEQRLRRPIGPVLDPFVMDKHVSWRKGSRKLVDQCAHYQVDIDGAHDSQHDAVAAARVVWRIAQRTPTIAERDLAQLHDEQVIWAAEQATSLREYFVRQGKTEAAATVDGTWPVRPVPARVPS